MSLLSMFISNHLIPALEEAIVKHKPDAQALIINEIDALNAKVGEWIKNKLSPKGEEDASGEREEG